MTRTRLSRVRLVSIAVFLMSAAALAGAWWNRSGPEVPGLGGRAAACELRGWALHEADRVIEILSADAAARAAGCGDCREMAALRAAVDEYGLNSELRVVMATQDPSNSFFTTLVQDAQKSRCGRRD